MSDCKSWENSIRFELCKVKGAVALTISKS